MPTRPLVTSHAEDLRLWPDAWHKLGLLLWTVLLLVYPFLANSRWLGVGNLALIMVVGSLALMILTGFCGQISLGHAAFLAIGAYTAAIFGVKLGWAFWLVLPCAGLAAAAVGLAVGPFALRLEGLYLAIVTLGLLFLVTHVLHSLPDLTGGVSGISVPMHGWFAEPGANSLGGMSETWHLGPLELSFERKLWFIFLAITLVATMATKNLQRSPSGRAMMAVRDHDLAAAVLGVDPARTKVIAFGLSSFLAGIAGAMFAWQQQYITIEPPFDLNMSVQFIAIIVFGGLGSTFGAVAGAVGFTFLTPLVEQFGRGMPLIGALSSAQRSSLLFAVLVCVFLVTEPLGLLGIWLRIKRYFAGWPFRY